MRHLIRHVGLLVWKEPDLRVQVTLQNAYCKGQLHQAEILRNMLDPLPRTFQIENRDLRIHDSDRLSSLEGQVPETRNHECRALRRLRRLQLKCEQKNKRCWEHPSSPRRRSGARQGPGESDGRNATNQKSCTD